MEFTAPEPTMFAHAGLQTAMPETFVPMAASLDFVSPYLNRPLRRIEEVERGQQSKGGRKQPLDQREQDRDGPSDGSIPQQKRP